MILTKAKNIKSSGCMVCIGDFFQFKDEELSYKEFFTQIKKAFKPFSMKLPFNSVKMITSTITYNNNY